MCLSDIMVCACAVGYSIIKKLSWAHLCLLTCVHVCVCVYVCVCVGVFLHDMFNK